MASSTVHAPELTQAQVQRILVKLLEAASVIQDWVTPEVRATSDCDDPARTAVFTRRPLDTDHGRAPTCADVLRHASPMS